MRPVPLLLAALLALGPAAAAPAAPPGEGLAPLKVNPLRKGLDGWERSGTAPDKAFAWNSAESVLTIKGQSGKEPPRLVFSKVEWDQGSLRFQAKKGARKIRVVLQPVPKAAPVALEFPKDAIKAAQWTDLGVALRGTKAVLLVPGADGNDAEVGSAEIPAGARFRFGFEAPPGTDAVLTGIVVQREYEDAPPFAEEGFTPIFDGKTLEGWRPLNPDDAPLFTVENGLLVGQVRAEGGGGIFHVARMLKEYELRFRAYWGTTHLAVRAVEFPGADGKINKFDSIQVNLGDNIDPENVNDISIRVAGGACVITVNGKKVLEEKVKPFDETPVGFFVERGKKFLLRDIRVRDIPAGEGK
jgi:hypothetical protein